MLKIGKNIKNRRENYSLIMECGVIEICFMEKLILK